jgi:hypothetical protein
MTWLLFLLFTKHLIFDFVYQPPYQWQNKGTYGHLGGIVHSGQHAIATLVLLPYFTSIGVALFLATLEFVIHYHMDWFKMWYNKKKGWGPATHNEFWVLTGIDQWVHALTYLGITGALLYL